MGMGNFANSQMRKFANLQIGKIAVGQWLR